MRPEIAALPVLLYPGWSHLCVAYEVPGYSVPGLAVLLACAIALRGLDPRPGITVLLGVGLVTAVAVSDLVSATPLALYLPPILVPATLAWLFGRSLLPGRTALITRFAVRVMGHDTPEIARYTRGVTICWTLGFLALMLEALLLAVYGSWLQWSLFTNGINYVIVALAFLAELLVRRLRFGRITPIRDFVSQLVRTDFRRLG